MQLYLDIDGVLLTKRGVLSEGAETFLRWCVGKHDPFWISTRTRDGSIHGALRAFHNLLDPDLVEAIRPTRWETLKTECLPIASHNWLWLDNEILHAERAVLTSYNALDHFIQVNVDHEPAALVELQGTLCSMSMEATIGITPRPVPVDDRESPG
jgi:hypothetical protein